MGKPPAPFKEQDYEQSEKQGTTMIEYIAIFTLLAIVAYFYFPNQVQHVWDVVQNALTSTFS